MINVIQDWSAVLADSLQGLISGVIAFIPKLLGAVIVFIVGWIIAVWIGKLVSEILKRLKLDRIFEKTKWEEAMEKAEVKMKMSGFLGAIVKWVLAIMFLGAGIKILGIEEFGSFVDGIVGWLPNLVVATAIFVVAVILADFAEKITKIAVAKMKVRYANLIGGVVRWSIWLFAGFAILAQLAVGAAAQIVQILITGVVALVVISMALAFGLGGKDVAKEILMGMRNKMKD
ncbi:hypothetical protein COU05_02365 [bacterium (Candidatus Gribaldobacteria) CG10_big_fil_rev_8_21_14_0_10_37_21]|uniref:Small-conductance mechanosensitive ion channel n=1 Tax=bacterium (Candidatus Gribaldobacteria) CG10_big_fil_rev_8_21_14_0_10_37_21 TaxID=2014275 RepID=A0A2H0UU44_9BACT|nr:MAG: hypothetical protein AUJ25_02455 [Parcubacteria group bacterium CG1_02_37_13]PIR90357.1 MAG: hypothetical protein COU05_02365 [bacterium (Candidatus Gribaldobacteria) CG10_big_fil_rev_8_21_14_0_10_37_21]